MRVVEAVSISLYPENVFSLRFILVSPVYLSGHPPHHVARVVVQFVTATVLRKHLHFSWSCTSFPAPHWPRKKKKRCPRPALLVRRVKTFSVSVWLVGPNVISRRSATYRPNSTALTSAALYGDVDFWRPSSSRPNRVFS